MPTTKAIRRINATLPEPLAAFVAKMTGKGGAYETPSEFIRDLIRRRMEGVDYGEPVPNPNWDEEHREQIIAEIEQSMKENNYAPLTEEDHAQALRIARGEEKWPPE